MTAPPWWAVLAATVFLAVLVAAQVVDAYATNQLYGQLRGLRGQVTRLEHPAARAHVREYRYPIVTARRCPWHSAP